MQASDRIARGFVIAALAWGAIAMAIGLVLAVLLLLGPGEPPPFFAFGRLRPVHTTCALYAFLGNAAFAGIYHVAPRALGAPLRTVRLATAHLWGWQLALAGAVLALALGHSQSKPYAELEWPFDIALAMTWVCFAATLIDLIRRRTVARLPAPIWFFVATLIGVGLFHALGALVVPVGWLASEPLFGGVGESLLQQSTRQAVLGFLVAAPLAGVLYDILPRAAGRPLYSIGLARLHFWSLVLVAGWAGPRFLLATALPERLQSVGVIAGVALWLPSAFGALNGVATARGAAARRDPVLGFASAAFIVLALAGFDGALLSTQTVAALAQYTDWMVGNVHALALGWGGLAAAASFYWIVPRIAGVALRSPAAAAAHLYLAIVGLAVYLTAMWLAGATQGVMLAADNGAGGLAYDFAETVAALDVAYWARLAGGAATLIGFGIMTWNLAATLADGRRAARTAEPVDQRATELAAFDPRPRPRALAVLGAPAFVLVIATAALLLGAALLAPLAAFAMFMLAGCLALAGAAGAALGRAEGRPTWLDRLEHSGAALAIVVAAAVALGPAVELGPLLEREPAAVGERAALERAGRAIYLDEGCVSCHSQQVRPFLGETARYGAVSSEPDSDRSIAWGSRRIGPDLARVGSRRSATWLRGHLLAPRSDAATSRMPSYRHLDEAALGALVAYLASLGR